MAITSKTNELDIEKAAKKFAKQEFEKTAENYLYQLQKDIRKIEAEILPHLDEFKLSSNKIRLMLDSDKYSKQMKNKLVKKLIGLYLDEKEFIAKCNTVKVMAGGYTFKTLGSDEFKDRIFGQKEEKEFNIYGNSVYADILCFDKDWKNSENVTMQQVYHLRQSIFVKLDSYNAYLDDVKEHIESITKVDLDKKLNKRLEKQRNADFKEFKKKYGKHLTGGLIDGSSESVGLLGLGGMGGLW